MLCVPPPKPRGTPIADAALHAEYWRNDPILGVDKASPDFRNDPHPLLKRLREFDPVNVTPLGTYRLTRYHDVLRMLGTRTTSKKLKY